MLRPLVPVLLAAAAAASGPFTVTAVSGTPQSAWGYVASDKAAYDAQFPTPLVVQLHGAHQRHAAVRFTCVTRGCVLPPSDQPDEVTRVDPQAYDVKSDDAGKATISLTIELVQPGPAVVQAAPVVNGRPRTGGAARFVLTIR
ncbi:MAG TPA: hypothetical protein VMD91_16585 [Candidatus Sulfotelmatobacter sp.]|nr:hypothetical protein [Candidatus Sulfotelmatobacter sp.]